MKFVVSLDYELFFGVHSGTPASCMIEPTNRIVDLLESYGCLLTLFVDAACLSKLRDSGQSDHREQYDAIATQLNSLVSAGHDVQLHVHTHWEDTFWSNGRWEMETRRYRLHDFDPDQRCALVRKYVDVLEESCGARPIAFRAGGWCLQPFTPIAPSLVAAGIRIDSTVYAGGRSTNPGREFDYRRAPDLDFWRFDADPLRPEESGRFLEVPISAFSTGPQHYWRILLERLRGHAQQQNLGDGIPLANTRAYYLRKLFWPETTVVSVDGSRAALLESAWLEHAQRRAGVFNVMGHPKSLTTESLARLDGFLRQHRGDLAPATLASFSSLLPPIDV